MTPRRNFLMIPIGHFARSGRKTNLYRGGKWGGGEGGIELLKKTKNLAHFRNVFSYGTSIIILAPFTIITEEMS